MFTSNAFQKQLFEQIFDSTTGKSKITADLMAILGCSRASLYRKRIGSTPLTADELIKIANHFSLSIDALRSHPENNSHIVVCTTLPPIQSYADIDFYIDNTKKKSRISHKPTYCAALFHGKRSAAIQIYGYAWPQCIQVLPMDHGEHEEKRTL